MIGIIQTEFNYKRIMARFIVFFIVWTTIVMASATLIIASGTIIMASATVLSSEEAAAAEANYRIRWNKQLQRAIVEKRISLNNTPKGYIVWKELKIFRGLIEANKYLDWIIETIKEQKKIESEWRIVREEYAK